MAPHEPVLLGVLQPSAGVPPTCGGLLLHVVSPVDAVGDAGVRLPFVGRWSPPGTLDVDGARTPLRVGTSPVLVAPGTRRVTLGAVGGGRMLAETTTKAAIQVKTLS